MIKFRCACQKKIGVPADYAGKTIKCPACGASMVVPQLELEPVSAGAEGVSALEEIESRSSIWSDDLLAQTQPVAEVEKNTCPQCGRQVRATRSVCPGCQYSFVPDVSQLAPVPAARAGGSGSSFIKDAIRVLTPVRSGGEAVTLTIATVLYLLPNVMRVVPFYGLYGSWIIQAYFCAYMFHILLETANGETRLPDLPFSDMPELRAAFVKMIISYLYACLPIGLLVLGALIMMGQPEGASELDGFQTQLGQALQIGTLAGMFFWPMIALSIALGDTVMVRPDKIVLSIIRTVLPYCLCCAIMYLSFFLNYVAASQINNLSPDPDNNWILNILFDWAGLLAMIAAMRVVGVYYLHNRGKIDW